MANLQQIAKAAGVSVMTVSRILNGRNKEVNAAAAARAAKVRQIASQMQYRPNAAARAIASGRFSTAGLLLSTDGYRSYLPSSLLTGIIQGLTANNMHLTVAQIPDEKLTSEGSVPKLLREMTADGLLINYTDHIPDAMLRLIHDNGIPCVWINCKLPADCAYPDDFAAAQAVAQHLLNIGHRRIAYIDFCHGETSFAECHYSAADRYEGYASAMSAAGLRGQLIRGDGDGRWVCRLKEILGAAERPTAFVGYGESDLLAVMRAADQLGLRVPDDVSLISFGDGAGAFAEAILPEVAVGQAAVEMLMRKLKSPSTKLPPEPIAFDLKCQSTLAPPPK
jgi:LacI family transcriptional regulator